MKDIYNNLKIFRLSEYLRGYNYDIAGKQVLFFGNFGALNKGDDAILEGEISDLGNLKFKRFVVVTRYPESIQLDRKIYKVSVTDFKAVIKCVAETDYIVFGGGGLYCKNNAGLKGMLFQLYFTVVFLLFPLILQKCIFVYGIGFYPNTNRIVSNAARILFNYVEIVTVRDAISYKFLKDKISRVKLFKDNSYLMEELSNLQLKKTKFKYFLNGAGRKKIGIALKKPSSKRDESILYNEITRFIKDNSSIYDFFMYSLDYHPKYENDYKFNLAIVKAVMQLEKKVNCYLVPTTLSVNETFSSFKLMDYIIAMRFHSAVFAYRFNKNFFGISYDLKCKSFISSIGKKATEIADVKSNEINLAITKGNN